LNGAWTRTWQGTDPQYDDTEKLTLFEALQANYGDRIEYVPLATLDSLFANNISSITRKASSYDEVIVCLGELPSTEKPGDINSLELPQGQIDLCMELSQMGVPMTAVMMFNRPMIVSQVEPLFDAMMMAYNSGDEGGKAIADIIAGNVNPSGCLPITYPRYVNTHLTYDHKRTEAVAQDFSYNAFNPQWQFGESISYSACQYSDVRLASDTIDFNGSIDISMKIKNESSEYSHKEVVQIYITDRVATITPSAKRLRDFEKIEIEPAGNMEVSFSIPAKELSFIGMENTWILEEGWYDVHVGDVTLPLYLKK
jgi:beta-glucosidase